MPENFSKTQRVLLSVFGFLLALPIPIGWAAQEAILVQDIWPGLPGSNPAILTNVNGILFFAANDGIHGDELWKSDGTIAGTVLVKDIFPGSASSLTEINSLELTNVNGTLFFAADDGVHGRELWKSDGTAAGTVLVQDILPGSSGSLTSFGKPLTNVNGTLFFAANDGVHNYELWKSDGTATGTVLVKDILPGPAGGSGPWLLTNVNGTLFFAANDGVHNYELWKSDGTTAGTVLVKDINPGSNSLASGELINFNGTLLFTPNDGVHGRELWKSDGTAAGTVLVKDIFPGSSESLTSFKASANVNGTLFFRANNGVHGTELWKSDGSTAGTVLFQDIWPGVEGSSPSDMTNVNGILFFAASDGGGRGFWKNDGTDAGTMLVQRSAAPSNLTNVNGAIFYTVGGGERIMEE